MTADKPVAEAFEAFAGAAPHAAGAVARWTRGGLAVAVAATKKELPADTGANKLWGRGVSNPCGGNFKITKTIQ